VDHAKEMMLTIGTQAALIEVGTLNGSVIITVGDISATGTLIGTVSGDIDGKRIAIAYGVATPASL